ncbi:MAG: ribonuclease III [Ruminococcaceae bacterium]|nr:ribonuclease III [Oscillospiraceae bacterium]
MAIGKSFSELEKKLGYVFSDSSYLENALTHSSYSNEYKSRGLTLPSNERLEFLGDAVLQISVSEYLYDNFKSYSEGRLTRMRQMLVCEKTLAKIAASISLGDYIHLGRGEENDCRTRPKVLADTLEAVLGAMFIDSREKGNDNYKKVIASLLGEQISKSDTGADYDYKTMLQQFIEKDGSATLEYEVVEENGPEHKKEFTSVAKVNNNIVGKGVAFSKKDSEMQAAKHALMLFGFKF